MPLTIDATVGGASSNSYVLLADAEAYMLGRVNPWTGTDAAKDTALVNATSLLDQEQWAGTKGTSATSALTQALAWPRRWVPTLEFTAYPEYVTDNFIDTSVAFYSSLVIPTPIVRATCELAMELLRAGTTDRLTFDSKRNVKRTRVDVLDTEYFDPWQRVRGLGYFPSVLSLVAHMLRSADGGTVDRV
jgi:hypothetical protein